MRRAALVVGLVLITAASPGVGPAQTLDGAIDLHAHAAPDGTPRKLDAIELAQLREAARRGAWLELIHSPLTDEKLRAAAEAIRTIGAASFVLSSDLGQPSNPVHTDGLIALYRGLLARGVTSDEIDAMARRNPARLLGLDP